MAVDDLATARRELDAARQATRKAQHEAAKAKVIHHFGLSGADAELLDGDEETMARQAERLTELNQQALNGGNYVPREGSNPAPPPPDPHHVFVRDLFNTGEYP